MQMPYCCVPATLQWVLYRRGINIFDQESIGVALGLVLPLRGKSFFQNKQIVFTDIEPSDGYGTRIELEKYSIPNFFKRKQISLHFSELIYVSNEKQLSELLKENFITGNDIILRYNNKITTKDGQKSYGHFSLITQYDSASGKVVLGDPELPFFKTVSLKQIIFSVSDEIDGTRRGIYIISDKSS